MQKKLLEKIKKMIDSDDKELRVYARVLFWANRPSYENYRYLGGMGAEKYFNTVKEEIKKERKSKSKQNTNKYD